MDEVLSLISEETICLKAEVKTWQQAITVGGKLLLKNDFIEEGYIQAMIDNMLKNGPYFVLTPGVAMPHADSQSGVKKMSISLVTLANPINFLESPNNPVQLVICLAASSNESHLDLLKKVSQLLSNPEDIQKIINANKIEEVLQVFNP